MIPGFFNPSITRFVKSVSGVGGGGELEEGWWEIVGSTGTTTNSASSNSLTLSEPSGAAQGDLLVACITHRGTEEIQTPAGWTQVAQTGQGDSSDPGVPNAYMAYIIRGASAPSFVFSFTGSSRLMMGCVNAYRGILSNDALEAVSSNTPGSSSSSVTTASLTTAEDNALLVALAASGDSNTFSNFDAATDPSGNSGSSEDKSTVPLPGVWTLRETASSTSGPDGGIGVADAVKSNSGSTGTLSASASASDRHAMIVAAFNPGFLSPGALEELDLIATSTNGVVPNTAQAGDLLVYLSGGEKSGSWLRPQGSSFEIPSDNEVYPSDFTQIGTIFGASESNCHPDNVSDPGSLLNCDYQSMRICSSFKIATESDPGASKSGMSNKFILVFRGNRPIFLASKGPLQQDGDGQDTNTVTGSGGVGPCLALALYGRRTSSISTTICETSLSSPTFSASNKSNESIAVKHKFFPTTPSNFTAQLDASGLSGSCVQALFLNLI